MKNLTYVKPKNIFKVPGDVYFIPVNTVGVMGAGIAKEFKERFPDLFLKYKKDCKTNALSIKHPLVYQANNEKYYVMFPTKDNWRNPSQANWIAEGLENFMEFIGDIVQEEHVLVIPPLGCGHGRLDYVQVKEIVENFSNQVKNPIVLIEPFVGKWYKIPPSIGP